MTHIYASTNSAIIGSDNGLSPVWLQAIIWANALILLIQPLPTNFSEKRWFKFKHIHSGKCIWMRPLEMAILSRPQCVDMVYEHLQPVWQCRFYDGSCAIFSVHVLVIVPAIGHGEHLSATQYSQVTLERLIARHMGDFDNLEIWNTLTATSCIPTTHHLSLMAVCRHGSMLSMSD